MNSERTFATFRVVGDNLVPDHLTKLLGVNPTAAYSKGQRYSAGPRSFNLKGQTGVWYLSTDRQVQSDRLTDHIHWLLDRIEPNKSKLRQFMDQSSLRAVMTCFWHGPSGARAPVVPKQILEILDAIPASLEMDFDAEGGLIAAARAERA